MKLRRTLIFAVAVAVLAVWAFPVLWALLTSFKTERDVLAYPPKVVFVPTLANYADVLFGSSTILPNLLSSFVVAGFTTVFTIIIAVPAAYALARLEFPAKRSTGFYVLATQMLPPIGLIIPYYLAMQKLAALDTYSGLIVIYLTF
jgi:multiple sugar transport system permease protein